MICYNTARPQTYFTLIPGQQCVVAVAGVAAPTTARVQFKTLDGYWMTYRNADLILPGGGFDNTNNAASSVFMAVSPEHRVILDVTPTDEYFISIHSVTMSDT